MELFSFGMLAGAIVAIIFIGVTRIKDDRTVDQGKPNRSNNMDVCSGGGDVKHRNDRLHWYKYPQGSKEYQKEIEALINGLCTMQSILGLSDAEKTFLEDAVLYIEEKEGL